MLIQIENPEIPELDIYRQYNENQLRRFYEPEPGLFICESAKVILRALDAGYEPVSILTSLPDTDGETGLVFDRCEDIPIYRCAENALKGMSGSALTGGIMCAMRRKYLPEPSAIISGKKHIAVLEDVENPTNVGAIFRSAAALGIEAVILTHGCADPLYRRAARVSMGTVFQIPWTLTGENADVVSFFKEAGFSTVAMALSDNSVSISDPVIYSNEKLAVFLGNEGYGLRDDTVSRCDIVARIPMNPGIDSLNVAAASAVAFWELTRGDRKTWNL